MNGFDLIEKYDSLQRSDFDRQTFQKASDIARELGDVLNAGSRGPAVAGFLHGMLHTHRYLSEQAVLTLLTALGLFGDLPEASVSDARNAFTYKVCKKLRLALADDIYLEGVK